ncbi:tyrosine-type recombinase/integrase [Alicycliphilus sp. T452]|jgi:site-specific recombinase XerD
MFEALFSKAHALVRHRDGPWAEARERYLCFRASRGATRSTLQSLAHRLLVISRHIDLATGERITRYELEMAGERYARHQCRLHRAKSTYYARTKFVCAAMAWLRFLDLLEPLPAAPVSVFTPVVEQFAAFMRNDRALSAPTIHNQSWFVKEFLKGIEDARRSLADVSIADVDAFQAAKGLSDWKRITIARCASALRVFFRYAEAQGWCPTGTRIAACIDAPRLYLHEGLPAGPNWADVRQMIESAQGSRPIDIRDRAILLLFAVYGLRSKEVERLRLNDLDWTNETITIVRTKSRRTDLYPLVTEVGEAILRYLQQARPHCTSNTLFTSTQKPFPPVSQHVLYDVVSRRVKALGIQLPHKGPHCLRHACACHLVAEGFSLKAVGDHLGHRNVGTTRIYAKVDLQGLRKVAEFDLGGLL